MLICTIFLILVNCATHWWIFVLKLPFFVKKKMDLMEFFITTHHYYYSTFVLSHHLFVSWFWCDYYFFDFFPKKNQAANFFRGILISLLLYHWWLKSYVQNWLIGKKVTLACVIFSVCWKWKNGAIKIVYIMLRSTFSEFFFLHSSGCFIR